MISQLPSLSVWRVRIPTSPSETMAVSPSVYWTFIYFSFLACCFKWCSEKALALELVAMQQLQLYVKPNVLFLKCKIILTSKNILRFFKPDGRFWEPVWDHKYYLKCTTKTGNNESYWFDGLEDNSLCVVTLSQLMMFKEHSNTKWCCWEVYDTFKDGKKRNYIKRTITNYGNCRKRSWAQVQWLARVFFVWSLHDLLVPTWVLTRYGKTHSY